MDFFKKKFKKTNEKDKSTLHKIFVYNCNDRTEEQKKSLSMFKIKENQNTFYTLAPVSSPFTSPP